MKTQKEIIEEFNKLKKRSEFYSGKIWHISSTIARNFLVKALTRQREEAEEVIAEEKLAVNWKLVQQREGWLKDLELIQKLADEEQAFKTDIKIQQLINKYKG